MSWIAIDGQLIFWPMCVIPGCQNRICLAKAERRFCWPHSDSGTTVHDMILEAQLDGIAETAQVPGVRRS